MINFKTLARSFKFALSGISYSFKENQNIKIHIGLGIVVILLGLLLGFTRFELFSVALLSIFVISAEMINSAIEEVVDLLVDEHNEHARIAKDVSAGMVLLIAIFAIVVGFFIFIPHIISIFL